MHTCTRKKLLFSFRHAPYSNLLAKEGIDAVLASSAYNQQLSIIFLDDGVFQLIKNQHAQAIASKNIERLLSAFALYDINNIFICSNSLTERGLSASELAIEGKLINADEIHQLFLQQDHILSF